MVSMYAFYLFLDSPWQSHKKVLHDGEAYMYEVVGQQLKHILKTLREEDKPCMCSLLVLLLGMNEFQRNVNNKVCWLLFSKDYKVICKLDVPKLLDKYANIMPSKLLTCLPTMCGTMHYIHLIRGSKIQEQSTYRLNL